MDQAIWWPEEGYEDVEGTIESLKRLGHAIEDGTAHKGNGQWLVRFAQALEDANQLPTAPVLGEAETYSQAPRHEQEDVDQYYQPY